MGANDTDDRSSNVELLRQRHCNILPARHLHRLTCCAPHPYRGSDHGCFGWTTAVHPCLSKQVSFGASCRRQTLYRGRPNRCRFRDHNRNHGIGRDNLSNWFLGPRYPLGRCDVVALQKIRNRDIVGHGRWMVRSFALTFSFVSLRIIFPALQFGVGLDQTTAFQITSWACWLVNLLIVETALHGGRVFPRTLKTIGVLQ
jgi:hypothetical protein